MSYDAVREQAIIAAREAVELLNELEKTRQPSRRWHWSLRSIPQVQLEREAIPFGEKTG